MTTVTLEDIKTVEGIEQKIFKKYNYNGLAMHRELSKLLKYEEAQ